MIKLRNMSRQTVETWGAEKPISVLDQTILQVADPFFEIRSCELTNDDRIFNMRILPKMQFDLGKLYRFKFPDSIDI